MALPFEIRRDLGDLDQQLRAVDHYIGLHEHDRASAILDVIEAKLDALERAYPLPVEERQATFQTRLGVFKNRGGV